MMQIMTNTRTWQGLTDAEWIKCWDETPWRAELRAALLDILTTESATLEQRVAAMNMLDHAVHVGVVTPDSRVAATLRDALRQMIRGARRPWWRRVARERATSERLAAVQSMLQLAAQLMQNASAARAREAQTSAANEALLS